MYSDYDIKMQILSKYWNWEDADEKYAPYFEELQSTGRLRSWFRYDPDKDMLIETYKSSPSGKKELIRYIIRNNRFFRFIHGLFHGI